MVYMYRIATIGIVAAAGSAISPAQASVVTFASYVQSDAGAGIRFVRTGTSGSDDAANAASAGGHLYTISARNSAAVGARAVDFTFLQPRLLAALGKVDAAFTLDLTAAAASPASLSSGVLTQPGLSGSFSFLYTGTAPLVVGSNTYYTKANLLSGTIGQAFLGGQAGSTSGGVNGATLAGTTILYTSDFLTFAPGADKDFGLALTQITAPLGQIDQYHALNGFRAVTTGSFSAEPSLTAKGLPLPEPATWGMMVLGFGLLGHQLRRRKADRAPGASLIG